MEKVIKPPASRFIVQDCFHKHVSGTSWHFRMSPGCENKLLRAHLSQRGVGSIIDLNQSNWAVRQQVRTRQSKQTAVRGRQLRDRKKDWADNLTNDWGAGMYWYTVAKMTNWGPDVVGGEDFQGERCVSKMTEKWARVHRTPYFGGNLRQ